MQSSGAHTREVDWCQSAALLVRREAAAQVGYLDPDFFVYSDEVDFARRLRDAGWRSVYVPRRVAVHHEQLSTDAVPERRIVELARNRDLYMRKHHSRGRRARGALADRLDLRAARARGARAARATPPRRYWRHVTATLHPERGEGLREAADEYNRAPTTPQMSRSGSSAYASTSPCPARKAATRRRASASSARACCARAGRRSA